MESHMKLDRSQERGKWWPLLFGALGALSFASFFYKFNYQVDDLLQGIGFLLAVPLAYFAPVAMSFRPRPEKLLVHPWLKGMAILGLCLVLVGFVIEWGWVQVPAFHSSGRP